MVSPPVSSTHHALADLSGIKVLAVDDEADARGVLQHVLEESGAEVRTAASVKEAVTLFQEFHPDVLVSDIAMPEQDGFTLISKIRELPPEAGGDVPAAALSAYAAEEDKRKAFLAGYQRHIPKPVDPAELTEIIDSLMLKPDAVVH